MEALTWYDAAGPRCNLMLQVCKFSCAGVRCHSEFVAPALSVMHRSIASSCTLQQRKVNPSLVSPDLQAGVMQSGHADGCVNGSASEHQRLAASANGLAACLQAQLHANGNGHCPTANGTHAGLGSDLGSEAASESTRPFPRMHSQGLAYRCLHISPDLHASYRCGPRLPSWATSDP